jgi:hypothetical protein
MRIVRFAVGILVSMFMFSALNTVNQPSCSDCFAFVGVPFRYYQEGGFTGGGHWLVGGVIGDLACIIAVGVGMGWTWGRLLRKRKKQSA